MIRWNNEAPIGLPYWWNKDPVSVRFDPNLPASTDILIVGGGYTGLSAALHAHDAGANVTVVDAGIPGHAASTRNGGMFGAHPRFSWDVLAKEYGPETATGIFGEAKTAMTSVRKLIEREKIDASYQNTGRIILGWTQKQFEGLKKVAEQLGQHTDIENRICEKSDLESEIATDSYFGGLLLPEHAGIDPKKFHEGLLCAVLQRGIGVVKGCAVNTWQRTRNGFVVETSKGTIRSQKMVVATGGYTGRNFMWARQRVFALPSFIIATEPLDPALIAKIAPGKRMMVETRARHSYYRISPDGSRILFGGRAFMRPASLKAAAKRQFATMVEIWPELENVRLSHVWTGNTGYSFGHMPWVGEHEGVHYAMGYSGSGTVMAPYLGGKVGLLAAEAPGCETAFNRTELRPSWLNATGTPWFLYGADLWFRHWVDHRENRFRNR